VVAHVALRGLLERLVVPGEIGAVAQGFVDDPAAGLAWRTSASKADMSHVSETCFGISRGRFGMGGIVCKIGQFVRIFR
jgi:hypothetical protein